jgi:isoprenylcysteine carboxyl methyltransferase (ICMT) family protein YpbQ
VICAPIRGKLPIVLGSVILEDMAEVTLSSSSERWVITAGSFEVGFAK